MAENQNQNGRKRTNDKNESSHLTKYFLGSYPNFPPQTGTKTYPLAFLTSVALGNSFLEYGPVLCVSCMHMCKPNFYLFTK